MKHKVKENIRKAVICFIVGIALLYIITSIVVGFITIFNL